MYQVGRKPQKVAEIRWITIQFWAETPVIEVFGTTCVLWTVLEISRLLSKARQEDKRRYRCWDDKGNEIEVSVAS